MYPINLKKMKTEKNETYDRVEAYRNENEESKEERITRVVAQKAALTAKQLRELANSGLLMENLIGLIESGDFKGTDGNTLFLIAKAMTKQTKLM
jgi:hypothetical protein